MIFYIIVFFDINLNYFKFSEYKGFYLNNTIFYDRSIINIKDRISGGLNFNEKYILSLDNKFYLGFNLFNLTISPLLGYSKNEEKNEIYYGTNLDYKKNFGNIIFKLGYQFNSLKDLYENLINMNLEIIDTFFLNFSLNSFLFSQKDENSYLAALSASFMLPYKWIYYGGGLTFKFYSKGNPVFETNYFNYYSPINIFFKICYNNNRNNGNIKLKVSVKDNEDKHVECNMKINERIFKIKDERVISLLPGRYRIKFYSDEYEDLDTTVVLVGNSTIEVILKKKLNLSSLKLKVIDKHDFSGIDAYVEIISDNTMKVKCDKDGNINIKILPGSYVIRILKEGYLTKGLYLDIEPSQEIEKTVTLQRIK